MTKQPKMNGLDLPHSWRNLGLWQRLSIIAVCTVLLFSVVIVLGFISDSDLFRREANASTKPLETIRLSEATGPLRVNPANPRYFTDGSGRAIYLTGSHTWSDFMDSGTTDPPTVFDYTAFLDFL